MISDPDYKKPERWRRLILLVDGLINRSDEELYDYLKNHVTEEDLEKNDKKLLLKSFRETMKGTFRINAEKQDTLHNRSFLEILRETSASLEKDLIEIIAECFCSWVKNEIKLIDDAKNKPSGRNSAAASMLKSVKRALERFENKKGFDNCEAFANLLEGYNNYSEWIRQKLTATIWNAALVLDEYGDSVNAAGYASKIYRYCSEKNQHHLRRIYKIEYLDIPESELYAGAYNEAADRFQKAGNTEQEFCWRLKAAENGWAAAMLAIGTAYAEGYVVAADKEKAIEWFRKGA